MDVVEGEIAIVWTDLTFRAKRFWFDHDKIILNNLKGKVNFESLNALMGPSGAGKTSLLNCLNGKNKSGLDSKTKIYLNSREAIRSSFVGQQVKEHLIMSLTAKQTLIYASKLKNSSLNEKISHTTGAESLLSELMLKNCENTRVCDMSGGEQKRLSVAIELTHLIKPNVLCIDEPTTGLDSNAAEVLMLCLKNLSETHKIAIIASIHQPNNDIFTMFDQIYVLAMGGICVYSGPPQQLRNHLNECYITCSSIQKPIEVLMTFASNIDENVVIDELAEKSLKSLIDLEDNCQNDAKIFKNGIPFAIKRFIWKDIWYLFMRTMITDYVCKWKTHLVLLLFYLFNPFLIRPLFNSDLFITNGCLNKNETDYFCPEQIRMDALLDQSYKYLFLTMCTPMLVKFMTTTIVFYSDLKLFFSEHRNKWYSTGVFLIVKNIIDLIPTVIHGILVAISISYWSGLLNDWQKLLNFCIILTTGLISAQSLSYLITICLNKFNEIVSIQLTIMLFIMNLICSNSLILLKDLKGTQQSASSITFFQYFYNSAIVLIYGLNSCSPEQISKPLNRFDLTDQTLIVCEYSLIFYLIISRIFVLIAQFISTTNYEIGKINLNLSKIVKIFMKKRRIRRDSLNVKEIRRQFSSIEEKIDINNEINIAWIDLNLNFKSFMNNEKTILRSLNGFFESGTLNALMGPSGAGKTTLLNFLSGKNNLIVSDDTKIYINKMKTIRSSFVEQDISSHLIFGLTVRESLMFASKLKNSQIRGHDHSIKTNKMLNELNIKDISDTRTEDCSGGQRKRIALGMELMSKTMPNLICIDEPTSGLDSFSAELVINSLRFIAKQHNITIITSIHQPNNDMLSMFDKLYVLSKTGICIYSGQPNNLEDHLNSCGVILNEVQYPIEMLIKFASIDSQNICEKLSEKVSQQNSNLLNRCSIETRLSFNGIKTINKPFYLIDLITLLRRFLITTYRQNWKFLVMELLLHLSGPLIVQSVSDPEASAAQSCVSFEDGFARCEKTEEQLENEKILTKNIADLFVMVFAMLFLQLMSGLIKMHIEIKTAFAEHRNGWYSTGSFYWAKFIIDLFPTLINLFIPLLLANMFSKIDTFLTAYIMLVISALTLQGVSHLIVIMFPESLSTAVIACVGYYSFQFVFSNWLVFTKELHYSVQWLTYFSNINLSFEAILIYIYGFNRCSDTEISVILYMLDIDDNTFYSNILSLITQLVVYRILAILAFNLTANGFNKTQTQELQKSEEMSEKQIEVIF